MKRSPQRRRGVKAAAVGLQSATLVSERPRNIIHGVGFIQYARDAHHSMANCCPDVQGTSFCKIQACALCRHSTLFLALTLQGPSAASLSCLSRSVSFARNRPRCRSPVDRLCWISHHSRGLWWHRMLEQTGLSRSIPLATCPINPQNRDSYCVDQRSFK